MHPDNFIFTQACTGQAWRELVVGWRRALVLACISVIAWPATARDLNDVRTTGVLKVCVAGSSAPLYKANGEALARFLNVKPQVTELATFDEQFQNSEGQTIENSNYEPRLLASGQCDIFPNDLHAVPWRLSKMQIVSYYSVRKVVVGRTAVQRDARTVADLAGRIAAVQSSTSYDSWLNQQNGTQWIKNPVKVLHAPTEESLKRVASGEADFTVLGTDGALKWVRSDPTRLAILFPVDEPVDVGWGVQKTAHSLALEVQRFFADNSRVGSDLDNNWKYYYQFSLSEYRLFQSSFDTKGLDLKTLLIWAAPVAVFILLLLVVLLISNLRSVEGRRRAIDAWRKNLEATIHAIVATLESRDPYTAGHQRRVAQLAAAIGQELGLSKNQIEGLHFGALIHDLGKIRVPDELLCKPSRLTPAEFEVLKMHPEVGYEIVRGIEFPWPVAEIIHQHHERFDGSGYPDGRIGTDILLEARILAVADTVEAMSSHRPYRPGLGIETALQEIEQEQGKKFDPAVAQACLRLFKNGFRFQD